MQPYYRHNLKIRGHIEHNDGIKTTDDANGLKGNEGKTTNMLQGNR